MIEDAVAGRTHSLTLLQHRLQWLGIGEAVIVADDARHILPELYRLDVLGARAFFPPAFREGHPLAFTQFVETDALEAR